MKKSVQDAYGILSKSTNKKFSIDEINSKLTKLPIDNAKNTIGINCGKLFILNHAVEFLNSFDVIKSHRK